MARVTWRGSRRPVRRLGIDPIKLQLPQIDLLDKDIDHPNRAVLANPIFQTFRKQRAPPAIHALHKALYPIPPQITKGIIIRSHRPARFYTTKTQSGPQGCVKVQALDRQGHPHPHMGRLESSIPTELGCCYLYSSTAAARIAMRGSIARDKVS